MLVLLDKNRNIVSNISQYKELKLEREIGKLDTLSLSIANTDINYPVVVEEMYVETEDNRYVVKEVNINEDNYKELVCEVDIQELKGTLVDSFTYNQTSCQSVTDQLLGHTTWFVSYCNVTKVRNINKAECTVYEILQEIQNMFHCDMTFDAKNKEVKIYEQLGSKKGTYFMKDLNLKSLSVQGDSRDFITELCPIGANGLRITGINDGRDYISDYTYSTQHIRAYWKDNRYDNVYNLWDDANDRLEQLSKPKKSYSVNIIDLANLKPDEYKVLSYDIGDTIMLVDKDNNIMDLQRIKKIDKYLEEPERNTAEISNVLDNIEDLVTRFDNTKDTVDNVTTSNGSVDGSTLNGVDWAKVNNVSVTNAQMANASVGTAQIVDASITNAKIDRESVNKLVVQSADIKDGSITHAKIGDEAVDSSNIVNAAIGNAQIDRASVNKLVVGTTDIEDGAITNAKIDRATANKLVVTNADIQNEAVDTSKIKDASIDNAKIADATIETAKIKTGAITTALIDTGAVKTEQVADSSITDSKIITLTANKLTAGRIDAGIIDVVNLNCDNLTAGTINGQRIADKAITTNKIDDKAVNTGQIANNAITDDLIFANTITGDKLVADSITAREIASKCITANEIASNTITSDNISSNTITADKLQIGDSTNLAVCNELTGANVSTGWNTTTISNGYVIRTNNNSDYFMITNQSAIPFRAGEQLYYEFYAISDVSVSTNMSVWIYDINKAWLCNGQSNNFTIGTTETKFSGYVTIPNFGTNACLFVAGFPGVGGKNIRLRRIFLKRCITGVLIEDGSVSANKIAGGVLTLGGSGNGDGKEVINDANNTPILMLDKYGITASGGSPINILQGILNPNDPYGGTIYSRNEMGSDSVNISHMSNDTSSRSSIAMVWNKIYMQAFDSNNNVNDYFEICEPSADGIDINSSRDLRVNRITWNGNSITSQDNRIQLRLEEANSGMEFGSQTVPSTTYIDFHSSGTNADYDTRLYCVGGNSNNGNGTLHVVGGFIAEGYKQRCVRTKDYGARGLNAFETAECYFSDFGESQLVNGTATIDIEKIFNETVDTVNYPYQVFLTKYGQGDIWVEERDPNSFIVKGDKDIKFGWQIVAKQIDYPAMRLNEIDIPVIEKANN
ncbi:MULTISPECIES: phage tail spike protein [Clostridium]|uniref:phage tail spike protein n=1 Tax=Clostridium TaxID=1485 RepID=UPI000A8FE596|nr:MULTISPECIES: phage tail spike protein [Clostridium]